MNLLRILILALGLISCELMADAGDLVFTDYCQRLTQADQAWSDASYTTRVILQLLRKLDCNQAATSLSTRSTIEIRGFKLRSVAPLANLSNVTSLDLSHNLIEDASPLATLTSLRQLGVSGNKITGISFVEMLPDLSVFKAADNLISDLGPLANNPKLIELNLNNNPDIKDLMALENLSLRILFLRKNGLTKDQLRFVSQQSKLVNLELGENKLASLEGVINDSHDQLSRLLLDRNVISDITPLKALKKCAILNINDNPVANLMPLTELPLLKRLGISNTRSSSVAQVLRKLKLDSLEAANVGLSDLSWIEDYPEELMVLDLSHNSIRDISALYRFKKLSVLKLSGNPIADVDIDWLSSLSQLKVLEIDSANLTSSVVQRKLRAIKSLVFERSRI